MSALVAQSSEQPAYARHRAAAAELGAALRSGDAKEIKRLIDQEERSFGWDFLDGAHGAATEAAFTKLAYRARMPGATFAV